MTDKQGGFTDHDVTIVEALSRIAGAAVKTARLQNRLRRVAVVEDRQRIARELHDSVIQEMFAVGLGLQGLSQLMDSPQAEATLLDAVDRLDGAVETLRSYIFELKREPDTRPALDDRLQETVARMGSAYPTHVSLSLDLANPDLGHLEEDVMAIVTESLSNALRHSLADTVEVRVDTTGNECRIEVSDNGHGFDPNTPTPGMGLENLRARVRQNSGRMNIESNPDGTRLEVDLPIS